MSQRNDAAQYQFKAPQKGPDGALDIFCVIARSGEYLDYPHGKELITDAALFGDLDNLAGLPVTLGHPPGALVTPENYQRYAVGAVVAAWRNGDRLEAKLRVNNRAAVDAVLRGMRGVSAGYRVKVSNGKQTSRQHNHIALVDVPRCAGALIHVDGHCHAAMTGIERSRQMLAQSGRLDWFQPSANDPRTVSEQARAAWLNGGNLPLVANDGLDANERYKRAFLEGRA